MPALRSLFWRLFGAFLLLAAVTLGTVTLLVSRASSTEVRGYVGRRGTMGEAELAAQLEAYFQGRGSWEGVDSLLSPPGRTGEPMMGHGMMGRGVMGEYFLADTEGRIIAGAGSRSGVLSEAERAGAVALVVGDQGIGLLLHTPSPGLSPEEELLGRLNRAVRISAGVAALAALIVAGILSGRLLRPVRALTRAAHGMAQGDLGQRVEAKGTGESWGRVRF